jgi:proton-translocating NAD(P)+ transhydrogenase
LLLKKGFKEVLIESNAGLLSEFTDDQYAKAGATIVPSAAHAFVTDIVLKVRPPRIDNGEVGALRQGATLISFLYPGQNGDLVKDLMAKKPNVFAMDLIPRISRAQVFDALRCVSLDGEVSGLRLN